MATKDVASWPYQAASAFVRTVPSAGGILFPLMTPGRLMVVAVLLLALYAHGQLPVTVAPDLRLPLTSLTVTTAVAVYLPEASVVLMAIEYTSIALAAHTYTVRLLLLVAPLLSVAMRDG